MPGPLAALLLAADTLVVGTLADPLSLDPKRATDVVSAAILVNVCEPLVRYRPDGQRVEAALATTWATADGRTWTFTLREGVAFHDGAALDADAVVANLESLRRAHAFAGRAERVGPLVVSITLEKPNAALLATLSQPFFALQSPRELAAPRGRPVGTGAFRLGSVRPGEVRLEAHPGYWGGPPRLGALVFRRLASEESLLQSLLEGEIDVTTAMGQEAVGRLRQRHDIVLDSQTGLNVAFLSLNNERPPLDDRRVRQALARAVDRRALVEQILAGHGEPARNPLPPALLGYARRTKELILDRPGAKRLLAQAGFPDGFETTLLTVEVPRPYMPAPLRLAEQIRRDLEAVGVRARLRPAASWAEYLERAARGDYDLAVLGWIADTTDPNDFLSALVASESVGATNRSRYRSVEMDTLLKQGRRGHGPAEREVAYQDAQDLFQRDMPWVPLYHVAVFTAYRRSVQGLVVGPTGVLRYDRAWKAGRPTDQREPR
jgi:ABC-type transport system substrate-binding protein